MPMRSTSSRLLTIPHSHTRPPAADRHANDVRLLALARAACAGKASLRRPFLRGRWRSAHVDGVAVAAVALGMAQGDLDPADIAEAERCMSDRLRQLLAAAPLVADGLNGLAEFLGGRATSHADRLAVIHDATVPKTAEDTAASAA